MTRWIALAASMFALSCTLQTAGRLDSTGYRSTLYTYSVKPLPGKETLMGEGWKVDNFYREGESETAKWQPKEGTTYETTYRLDTDGNGEIDEEVDTNRYDLRLTHAEHDGVITLRMIPISVDQGKKRLSVLLRRYVEGISGSGSTKFSWEESEVVVEKRYAARVLREASGKVADLEAHAATISIKNVDQLRLDPETPGSTLEVVLAHMPFRYAHETPRNRDANFPVLMVAVYHNEANEFEEGLDDFRDLVERIVINGKAGASIDYGPGNPSQEASAPTIEKAPPAPHVEVDAPEESTSVESKPPGESSESGEAP